jgi:hypothetical protein
MKRLEQLGAVALTALAVICATSALADTPQERKPQETKQEIPAQVQPIRVVLPAPWEPASTQSASSLQSKK